MPVIRKAPSFKPYAVISVIVDYLGLTPKERTLYLHYLIQAQITDTTPLTEELTGLSTQEIKRCRAALMSKYHLIDVSDLTITLLDVHSATIDLRRLLQQESDLSAIQEALRARLRQLKYEDDDE